MLLYKSHYLTVNLIELRYLMHLKWTKPADLLDQTGIYSEVTKFFHNRIKRRARLILWDFKVIEERVDYRFFQWLEQYVLPHLLSRQAKRIAYVMNSVYELDGFKNIGGVVVEMKVFDSQEEGMNWLLEVADMKPVGRSHHRRHHH